MTACTRSAQIDLAGFLVEPRAEEWAPFREHYPACAECSAEVARWSQLEAALQGAGQSSHPSGVELLAFDTDPETLSAEERDSVRLHLDSCAPCRDAFAAARSFDLASAIAPASATDPARTVSSSWLARLLRPLRETLGLLRPPLSPALVATGLLLLAIPLGVAIWSRVGSQVHTASPGGKADLIASGKPPLEAPAPQLPSQQEPAPVTDEPIVEERIVEAQIAEEQVANLSPPQPEPAPVVEPPPARPPAVEPSGRLAPEPAGEPEPPVGVLVASLGPESPLVYTPPSDFADAGLGRFPQARRSAGGGPTPLALAPDHVGLSLQPSPTLYWFMPTRAEHRIEFVLAAPDAIDPVLLVTTKAPIEPGFHALPLSDHGVTLEPGVTYRWSVALVVDEDQRYRDVIAGGAIARIHSSPALQAELEKVAPGAVGHSYAANGLWYDALDFASQQILEKVGEPSVRSSRAELLDQAGLRAAADYDRRAVRVE